MTQIDRDHISINAIEFFLVALLSGCGVLALAYVACVILGVTP